MSKKHENAGRLELMSGNKEYAAKKYHDAIATFTKAIDAYSQAGNAAHIVENLGKAYLNLAASYIANENYQEAIDIILDAQSKGYKSDAFTTNLESAYYNLGLKQADSKSADYDAKEAIGNFVKAQDLDSDSANTLYNLGITLIATNDHDGAKKVFTDLLAKNLPEDKFSLELQLNTLCKLVECQSKLHEDTESILEEASKILLKLDQTAHQEEAAFIYSHLAMQYLVKNDHATVEAMLKSSFKSDASMPETLAVSLEQNALHHYSIAANKDAKKEAVKMLVTLAHVKDVVSADLLETIKTDLTSISETLNFHGSDDFSTKVLGSIDICGSSDVDALFV